MEHSQTGADLTREGEEVELDTELAVIAPLGLLELVQVRIERGLRLPRRAVDALEHRALLVAPPVRARHPHQLERAESPGGRHVRPPAEVDERAVAVARVAVDGDHRALPDLRGDLRVDPLDDLDLVRLVGKQAEALVAGNLLADERLVGGDDLAHADFDVPQVVLGEVPAVGQLEVVVEAVLDGGPDGVPRAGEEVGDGLCHHVRGRVPEHLAAVRRFGRHDRDGGVVVDRAVEVDPFAVDLGGERVLRETLADRRRDLRRGDAPEVLALRAVGQLDVDRVGGAHLPGDDISSPFSS